MPENLLLASSLGDLFGLVVIIALIFYARRRLRSSQPEQAFERHTEERGSIESLARRLDALESRVERLETQAKETAASPAPVEGVPVAVEGPAPAMASTAEAAPEAAPPEEATGGARAARPLSEIIGIEPFPPPSEEQRRVVPELPPCESEFTLRRRELERRLMENWTGILGAVVVVAGVTFIGIYTALRLQPFYRFLLTLAAAGAFLGASRLLGQKKAWLQFSAWLRSTGAAILLFACAAAGGLPGLGLQWIHDPAAALALLLAGIAANLLIARVAGTEVFATLHVLLSLLPLAIVPATTTALAIASAVAAFGVGLATRGRWDRHLAAVLGAYALFSLLWAAQMGERLEPQAARYIAAGCAAIVFVAAALAHYRKDYAQPTPPAIQLGVHLANWGLLAFAMFAYLPGYLVRAGVLLALAVLAYRLGRRARGLRVAWLHQADTLTAQGLVLLALWTGYDLGAGDTLMLLIVLVETLAFRRLVERGDDELLDKVADCLPIVAAALLAIGGAADVVARPDDRLALAAMLAVGSACAVLGERLLRSATDGVHSAPAGLHSREPTFAAALAFLAGPLLLVALGALLEHWWMEATSLIAVSAILLAWRRIGQAGLLAATIVALVGSHVLSWDYLVAHQAWTAAALAPRMGPLAGLAALSIWLAGPGVLRLVAMVLLGADLGLAAYLFTDPISPLIPGVAWLILSLAALEVANRLKERESLTSLCLGYAYLVAFATAYVLVILQTPAYIGTLRARALIELFAIGVLAYWWFYRPRDALSGTAAWVHVHPLFLELILAAIAVTVVVEVRPLWWAVAWSGIALALLAPPVERLFDQRARLYSLLFYWISVGDMAVVMSVLEVPSRLWFEQPEFTSLLAIAMQVAYVAVSHRRLALAGLESPPPVRFLARLGGAVAARRNLYVYYPLFAGIAVFLFWRFDRSLLTLLWAAEAFVVFGLAAWLRENQFRYVALGGLAACLGRLVLIDMAEANLALRGLVFIGVGLLMLGMNAIYNRYRARFEA
ncbi:MAG: DUF2339 domain-containing protein [Gammaproteobacteria bacterium]|nr:DUF2339 domain-containing protein [Gammaproteobacteria bacterium]